MNVLQACLRRTIRQPVTRLFSAFRATRPAYALPAVAAAAAAITTGPHHVMLASHTTRDTRDTSVTGQNDARVIAQAKTVRKADAALPMVTVKAGETISGISAGRCGTAVDWTGIYAASRRAHQTARNANDLRVGQQLTIDCKQVPDMANRAPLPPPPAPVHTYSLAAHYSHLAHLQHEAEVARHTGAGSSAPEAAPVTAAAAGGSAAAASGTGEAAAPAPAPAPVADTHVTTSATGYEACVISRESGGQLNVMNASGHYGLYQFDAGTWASGGGNPADFGHASSAEQHQVFENVYAARGTQPWSPSDGC